MSVFRITSIRASDRQSALRKKAEEDWDAVTVVNAAHALGWHGEVRGPVDFGDVRFVAVCTNGSFGPPGSGWLAGCLVPATDPRAAVEDASLLAGYSSRAVLVRGDVDMLELSLQTALLDQGAVVDNGGEVSVLSVPGDVVPSPLQDGDTWRMDRWWLELKDAVLASDVVGVA